ncbi:hypothetical protein [Sporosarcina psychrophila]|uniref:Terminase n=1 Tax=Sporosarcina psychrophila TaxID=1476 RepID=A0ABV2KBY7_SPOPS
MANTAISVSNTKQNLTKEQKAAREVAEAITNQKPATKPKPFYKLDAEENKVFKKIRNYNEYYSDGDSLALTDLARALVCRERVFLELKALHHSNEEYSATYKAHKYWDDAVQHNMKILAVALGDRYKLAYDMSKIIQANMPKEQEIKQVESDPVLQLLEQI